MSDRKLYVVFGVAPIAFCDSLETARGFTKRYEEKRLEIREIEMNTEYTGLLAVPGESSDNDWMDLWNQYAGGGD